MRIAAAILQISFLISLFIVSLSNLLVYTGCEPPQIKTKPPAQIDTATDTHSHSGYAPAKIDIMPLTEFILTPETGGPSGGEPVESTKLRIYVSLLDSFNCQMKSPGVFRFELYKWILRSPEPKGRRVIIWPDIDLTDAVKNNQYWKDFLRAYEFDLDFKPQANQSYILQATFLSPDGRRLLAEFNFK